MSKNLERYDKLVIVILIISVLVFGIGYWFAQEKSEPVYLSKIDRLMFDKNNKSPAYILTLPDKIEFSQSQDAAIEDEFEKTNDEVAQQEIPAFSLEKLINNVPSLAKLDNKNFPITLKQIDPKPELLETTEDGFTLPKTDEEGHRPWIEYGNTVKTQPNFKKIAIVIRNLGFDSAATNKISSALPPEVSFSFHPYLTHAALDISTARQKGHETYMDIILASRNFLSEDTGPLALNFNLTPQELSQRFHTTISQPAAFGGVIIRDGAISDKDTETLKKLLQELRTRGLLMIDATTSNIIQDIDISGLARYKADIIINKDMTSEDIDNEIRKAENLAFDKGQVLLLSDDKPISIIKLSQWIETFSPQLSYEESKAIDITKPFALVPVSNLVVE